MRARTLFDDLVAKFRLDVASLVEETFIVDCRRSRKYEGSVPIKGGKVPRDGEYSVKAGSQQFVMTVQDCKVVIKRSGESS